ncbi:unnamed protein product [Lactuca virosa]|uniref:SURF1-like protein n=1 Tax=Lactuca virosa TaxID=75947 RepID=A0AAU9MWP0_9ASTR|nr:unnamed protein product [Lactuca virosa]
MFRKLFLWKSLYNAWVTTSKMRQSVNAKQIEIQQLRHNLKLHSIPYLKVWEQDERDHSVSFSGIIGSLESATLHLPFVEGAKNNIERIWYPSATDEPDKPFQNLHCLLIGGNKIQETSSIDALNSYPGLMDIRCSDPIILITKQIKEITPRERKESEIWYVRLVMSKVHQNLEEIKSLHPSHLAHLV